MTMNLDGKSKDIVCLPGQENSFTLKIIKAAVFQNSQKKSYIKLFQEWAY